MPGGAALLIALAALSGMLGVLFAIGQHDIKRLLAYHSVENIGIILLGIGIGMTGVAYGSDAIALFGFAGGLLHVAQPRPFQGIAVSRRGRGDPSNRDRRDRPSGRPDEEHARTRPLFFFVGVRRHLRPALLQRLYQRVVDLWRGNKRAPCTPEARCCRTGGPCRHRLPRAHRRSCRRLFHESFRHRLSRRAADGDGARRPRRSRDRCCGHGLLAALCMGIGMGSPSFSPSWSARPCSLPDPPQPHPAVVLVTYDREHHPGPSGAAGRHWRCLVKVF